MYVPLSEALSILPPLFPTHIAGPPKGGEMKMKRIEKEKMMSNASKYDFSAPIHSMGTVPNPSVQYRRVYQVHSSARWNQLPASSVSRVVLQVL